jgi:DNA helicase-2/ATP-dependent DNA helicase PcrA
MARRFVSSNQDRLDKEMKTDRSSDLGDIYLVRFTQEIDEIDFACDKIDNLIDTVWEDADGNRSSIRYGDIAILLRRRDDMEAWIKAFERRGLPFTVKGRDTLFIRPETNIIRYGMAFMASGVLDSYIRILDDRNGPVNQGSTRTFEVTETDLRNLINRCQPPIRDNEDRIIEFLIGSRAWFAAPTSRRIQPQQILQDFIASMGFDSVDLRDPRNEAIMYDLGEVSNLFMEYETVRRMIFPEDIIDIVTFSEWAYIHADCSGQVQPTIDAINITTIHGAKGTEFPVIFVPSLTKLKFGRTAPNDYGSSFRALRDVFDYGNYDTGEEELRRLLYVAMTRSKKFLFMTSASRNIGYVNRQAPHQFFEELQAQTDPIIITSPMADPTARVKERLPPEGTSYVYPTSYSEIRYYINCPYEFLLRTVFKIRPMIDSSFGYGSAVHNSLRRMHKEFEDGGGLMPSSSQIEQLVDDQDTFYLRYSGGAVEENLKAAAKKILKSYVANYGSDIARTFRAEVPFEFPIEDTVTGGVVLVSGAIDLMEKMNERGEVTEVEVVDFKTSVSPQLAWDSRVMDAEFQVRLYAKATQTNMDLRTARGFVHYLNDGQRNPVDVGDIALNQVEMAVAGATRGIINRNFGPSSSSSKCADCDHKKLCVFKA